MSQVFHLRCISQARFRKLASPEIKQIKRDLLFFHFSAMNYGGYWFF